MSQLITYVCAKQKSRMKQSYVWGYMAYSILSGLPPSTNEWNEIKTVLEKTSFLFQPTCKASLICVYFPLKKKKGLCDQVVYVSVGSSFNFWTKWLIFVRYGMIVTPLLVTPVSHFLFPTTSNNMLETWTCDIVAIPAPPT